RQLMKKKYDVVEFYGGEACITVLALFRLPRRSFLLVSHSNGLDLHYQEKLSRYLGSHAPHGGPVRWYQADRVLPIRKGFTAVDALITISEFERRYALSQGYQKEARTGQVEPGLPDTYLNQTIDWNREPIIGFCGSWLPRKGTKLIEADIPKIL